jgi:hypothetical protein
MMNITIRHKIYYLYLNSTREFKFNLRKKDYLPTSEYLSVFIRTSE